MASDAHAGTITCSQVSLGYPRSNWRVSSLDFEQRVSRLGVIGVNGAGKSTLLLAMAGALRPLHGQISMDGIDVYGPERKSALAQVGYVPQECPLPPSLRVGEAVAFSGWLKGGQLRHMRDQAEQALEQVGLNDRREDRVGKLSGGMKRRVMIACGLVSHPRWLLLDEPTAGLDPEQRALLMECVSRLPETTSVVMSSHIMADIEDVCEDVWVMDGGQLRYRGSLDSMVKQYGDGSTDGEAALLALLIRERRTA